MHLRILISIIFILTAFLLRLDSASAQKVLQCAPGQATVNNNLRVNGDLTVNNNATVSNNATVTNDLSVINGNLYLGSNGAKPYITDNAGSGILFYSQGGDNFLWQSPSGSPGSDAMILRAGGGLPTNNQFNLQVFGQVSSYQMHTQGIHLDMQGGIGGVPRPNILKFTNSAATGTGAAIFLGDPGAWDDNDLIFAQYTVGNDIGQIGIAMDAPSGNVGIRTVNPQITLAIGDNDTGLKWISDGNLQLVSNGTQELTIDPGNVRIRNNLCFGVDCKSAWPAAAVESDPIWTAASANYYTKTNLQTLAQASVLWDNLTGVPAGLSDGDQVGLTAVAWGDVSGKPAICPIGQFVTDISAGTCAVPPAAAAEADTLATVTTRGNTTTNAITVGGLTVDTNTLYVDSVSNRVGIGDATPASLFTVGNGDLLQITSLGYVQGPNGSAASPTFSFTGDTNTGIYTTGSNANTIAFSTTGLERARISNNGRFVVYDTLNTLASVDTDGNWVWTNVVNYSSAVSNGIIDSGWQSVVLSASMPVLGIRVSGSSDDGGRCKAGVNDYFFGVVTNRGYITDLDINNGFTAGQYSTSGAGGMATRDFLFDDLASGRDLGAQTTADNSAFNKALGLSYIPPGKTLWYHGYAVNGAATEYVNCSVDVLYGNPY